MTETFESVLTYVLSASSVAIVDPYTDRLKANGREHITEEFRKQLLQIGRRVIRQSVTIKEWSNTPDSPNYDPAFGDDYLVRGWLSAEVENNEERGRK